jgi:hypothetical protein
MTKEDLKNKQRVWVYNKNVLLMLGQVNKLPNGYTTLIDPKGFTYPMSVLEKQYPDLRFEIYEKI